MGVVLVKAMTLHVPVMRVGAQTGHSRCDSMAKLAVGVPARDLSTIVAVGIKVELGELGGWVTVRSLSSVVVPMVVTG